MSLAAVIFTVGVIVVAFAVSVLMIGLWHDVADRPFDPRYERANSLLDWDWGDVWDELPPAPGLVAGPRPFDQEKE